MKTKPVDHAAVATAFDEEEQARGGDQRTTYIKLDANQTVIRLLPSVSEEQPAPYRMKRAHRMKNRADRWRNPLHGKFLIGNEVLVERALELNRITSTDVDMYSSFEDPFTKVAVEGKAAGLNKKMWEKGWGDTRFVFNAFRRDNPGVIGILEVSKTMRDNIRAILKVYPELFDPDKGFDLLITGNGMDGKARRYIGAQAARDASPVGFEWESGVVDLDNFLTYKAMPYVEKTWGAFDKFGDVIAQLGLTPVDFGLDPNALEAGEGDD